ncbi:MAG: SHOCT domain-containing protein [Candidatus Tectomicrobia bacterium]
MMAMLLALWTPAMAAKDEEWGPWGMHMMWGSWGIGMMIMMFLFWAVMIVGIVFLIRWLINAGHPSRQGSTRPSSESALDILKKRYANGEINKQEFDEIRQNLQ